MRMGGRLTRLRCARREKISVTSRERQGAQRRRRYKPSGVPVNSLSSPPVSSHTDVVVVVGTGGEFFFYCRSCKPGSAETPRTNGTIRSCFFASSNTTRNRSVSREKPKPTDVIYSIVLPLHSGSLKREKPFPVRQYAISKTCFNTSTRTEIEVSLQDPLHPSYPLLHPSLTLIWPLFLFFSPSPHAANVTHSSAKLPPLLFSSIFLQSLTWVCVWLLQRGILWPTGGQPSLLSMGWRGSSRWRSLEGKISIRKPNPPPAFYSLEPRDEFDFPFFFYFLATSRPVLWLENLIDCASCFCGNASLGNCLYWRYEWASLFQKID